MSVRVSQLLHLLGGLKFPQVESGGNGRRSISMREAIGLSSLGHWAVHRGATV